MGTSLEYDAGNRSYSAVQKLGEYHLGLCYCSTAFERYSVHGRHPALPHDDILQCMTSHHESFHSIQDLSTGFGCLINELMLVRDEPIIGTLRETLKSDPGLMIPLTRNVCAGRESTASKIHEIFEHYRAYQRLVDDILDASQNRCLLSPMEIMEGCAALYTEIYRRWHIYTENLNPPEEYADIYDFESLWNRVKELPKPYGSALQYYRLRLDNHWPEGSGVDLCNLFFVICDLSMNVPPLDTKDVEGASNYSTVIESCSPAERFLRITDVICQNALFPRSIPMEEYRISIVLSDVRHTIDYCRLQRRKVGAGKEIEARFHSVRDDSVDEFREYLDRVCEATGYDNHESVLSKWIRFLGQQAEVATGDETLKLRLRYMKKRQGRPHLLSSFANIRNQICGRDYPTYCRTKGGMRVLDLHGVDESGGVRFTIMLKMFIRNLVEQVLFSGVNSCPFVERTVYECPDETRQCQECLDLTEEKYQQCTLGKFLRFLDISISVSGSRCK